MGQHASRSASSGREGSDERRAACQRESPFDGVQQSDAMERLGRDRRRLGHDGSNKRRRTWDQQDARLTPGVSARAR